MPMEIVSEILRSITPWLEPLIRRVGCRDCSYPATVRWFRWDNSTRRHN